jgi:hypothetical protein
MHRHVKGTFSVDFVVALLHQIVRQSILLLSEEMDHCTTSGSVFKPVLSHLEISDAQTLAFAAIGELMTANNPPAICTALALTDAMISHSGFFPEAGQLLLAAIAHPEVLIRESAFSIMVRRMKILRSLVQESASLIIEILGSWALAQRDSGFPLRTFCSLLKKNASAFKDLSERIFELVSFFLSNGTESDISSAICIITELIAHRSAVALRDPYVIIDKMIATPFPSTFLAIRLPLATFWYTVAEHVDTDIVLNLIVNPSFRVETIAEFWLIAVMVFLGRDSLNRLRVHLPALVQVVADLIAEGLQLPDYTVAGHSIPMLIAVYGEELDVLWPLYLRILDALIDSGCEYTAADIINLALLRSPFFNRSVTRIVDIEKRMLNFAQLLTMCQVCERQAFVIRQFRFYVLGLPCVSPSALIALRWTIDRIEKIARDQKSSIQSLLSLVKELTRFAKVMIKKLDPHGIEELLMTAMTSINCEINWSLRALGLCLFRSFEEIAVGPPLELLPKITEILLNDCRENSAKALKFFIVLSRTRNDEFMAFGDVLFNFCTQGLTEIEGPSQFSDLLVAVLLQFPLNPDLMNLIFAHFPIINSLRSFQCVYQWILVQMKQIRDAIPLLLNSIIRMFCLNLTFINYHKCFSRDLLIELVVTIDAVQADPDGEILLEKLLKEVSRVSFEDGFGKAREFVSADYTAFLA